MDTPSGEAGVPPRPAKRDDASRQIDLIAYAMAQAQSAIRNAPTVQAPNLAHAGARGSRLLGGASSFASLQIEGYKLIREVHRGGQGVVFEAIQQSTARTVAVKVTRSWPVQTSADRARFEREVQLLAQLKHPNIVTIHDSGNESGCDFFVMDYIDGVPLDRFVELRELSHKDTLALFARICHAVNVAHLRGVIHRDLKPGNVLVDQAGEPYILDFGLAKTVGIAGVESEDTPTTTGQFVGSLPWASPEQAEGRLDLLDLRTDVYSLGVLLYQLLTRQFPYPVSGSLREVIGHIVGTIPEDPRRRVASIDDDIATIVLKCLRKAREERYETAGEVARDIDRYLRNEPIEARRDSVTYVLRKHLARHKITAGAAALFLIVIIAGLGTSLWFWNGAVMARDAERQERIFADANATRARLEADKALDIKDFVIDMLCAADPESSSGSKATVEGVLDAAAAKLDKGSLADHPLVEAGVRDSLGLTYHRLGMRERADIHAAKALELRNKHAATPEELAASHSHLGMHARSAGSMDDAEKHFREALSLLDKALEENPRKRAGALNNLGLLLQQRGKHTEALPILERALALDRRTLKTDDPDLAASLNNVALLLRDLGQRDRARSSWEESLAILRRVYGNDNLRVAAVLESLGGLELDAGKLDTAESLQRQANAIRERVLTGEHPHIAFGLNNLGHILHRKGDYVAAEATHRTALEMRRRLHGDEHPNVATSLSNLALSLVEQKRPQDAEAMYREGLVIRRAKLGADHPSTLLMENNLASTLRALQKAEEAETLAASVVARSEKALPARHRHLPLFRTEWGSCLRAAGRAADAERELLRAHRDASDASPPEKALLSRISTELAVIYEAGGEAAEAAKWRERAGPRE